MYYYSEERRLENDEKPLYVQLNWGNDVREGRFLLRNEDHPTVRVNLLLFFCWHSWVWSTCCLYFNDLM